MGANTDDRKDGDLTALIIYRLDQAEISDYLST